jgi:ABC-type Zn uptake system ZnuABC Zn-binding protein ZnuA
MTQPIFTPVPMPTRRRWIAAALSGAGGLTVFAPSAIASQQRPSAQATVRLLAAHPLAVAMTRWLIEGTPVALDRVAPDALPTTRHLAYLTGRGSDALAKAAASADAVIGLRSVWPEDPLYPLARRSNVRIVEIDAARPVDGALPGVALRPGAVGEGQYAWLDPTNLGRMADIVAHDLRRLAPGSANTIAQRLAAFKQRVVALAAEAGRSLATFDNVSVVSLSDRLDHFAAGFNLDLVERDAREDDAWTPDALNRLGASLRQQQVTVVLHHREPATSVAQAVQASGARLVVLSTLGQDPLAELQGNVALVVKGLASG